MPLLFTARLSSGVWILSPSGPITLGTGSEHLRETLIEKFVAGELRKITALDAFLG